MDRKKTLSVTIFSVRTLAYAHYINIFLPKFYFRERLDY